MGKYILVLLCVVLLSSGCMTVVQPEIWEFSTQELGAIQELVAEFDDIAYRMGRCDVSGQLQKLAAELWEVGSPAEEGEIVQRMINILWEFPRWQNQLIELVIENKGTQWFVTWVGEAVVLMSSKANTTLFTVYLTYAQSIEIQFTYRDIQTYFCETTPLPGMTCVETVWD